MLSRSLSRIHQVKDLAQRQYDFLQLPLELKSLDGGAFSGYAAVWDNVDALRDVCRRGCFVQTLKAWQDRGTWPRVLWRHQLTIGHTNDLHEDDHGLVVAGQLWIDQAEIRPIYEQEILPAKDSLGMSFGFVVIAADVADGVRQLRELELDDDITISPRPVNAATELIDVKSADSLERITPDIRATEGILRDAGFSRSAAKAVLASGYSALREAKDDSALQQGLSRILDSLKSLTNRSH